MGGGSVDPVGAQAAARETNWRQGYLHHFRRLVEAGLISDGAAVSVARAGLDSLHQRMRATTPDGEVPVDEVFAHAPVNRPLETVVVRGTAPRSRELSVPFHGERLRGDALQRQLDVWTVAGSMEPSAAEAVREVVANPEWLELAETMAMDRTTLTRELRPLEDRGLVVSRPGEDRRTRNIEATDEGRRAIARTLPLWREVQASVLAQMGPARWEGITNALEELSDAADQS